MQRNFVVVFVSFFLELESIETRKIKTVKIRGSSQKCTFWPRAARKRTEPIRNQSISEFARWSPEKWSPEKIGGGYPSRPFREKGGGVPPLVKKKFEYWGGVRHSACSGHEIARFWRKQSFFCVEKADFRNRTQQKKYFCGSETGVEVSSPREVHMITPGAACWARCPNHGYARARVETLYGDVPAA